MPHPLLTRRSFVAGATAALSAAAGAVAVGAAGGGGEGRPRILEPRSTEYEFLPGKATRNVFSYMASAPAPTLRVRQGERLDVRLVNRLKEPTTLHWHGIRVPNAMDGVPFLTQPYVNEGESFDYSFVAPDAGSYWYHPHCNSLAQMSYGLGGLLIVEEAKDPGFDADLAFNLRDWRLDDDGQFRRPLYVPRQTARAGTLGTRRTTDWQPSARHDVPAAALVRARLVVTDVTRIYRLAVEGAPALVIALDGNPLPSPMPLDVYAVGPGQRLDLVIRTPDAGTGTVRILDHSAAEPYVVAELSPQGPSRRRDLREVPALPVNPMREPDLGSAITLPFEFQATAEQVPKSPYCGELPLSFWAINRQTWPGLSPDPTAPLAELKLGRSYVLSLHNRTPHAHPVHLHGMSFKLLKSDRRALPSVWTDTALLLPDESIEVALVADNPGDWVFHCHVIEHQEAGMTGFIRVT